MIYNEIPKESYIALVRYKESSVYFFRFDATENTESGTVTCSEETVTVRDADYSKMVSALIEVKYSLDAQMALLYNYQSDAEKYAEDMATYQEWRTYCKQTAKDFFGIDTDE